MERSVRDVNRDPVACEAESAKRPETLLVLTTRALRANVLPWCDHQESPQPQMCVHHRFTFVESKVTSQGQEFYLVVNRDFLVFLSIIGGSVSFE